MSSSQHHEIEEIVAHRALAIVRMYKITQNYAVVLVYCSASKGYTTAGKWPTCKRVYIYV